MENGYEDDVAWRLSLFEDPQNSAKLEAFAVSIEEITARVKGSLNSVFDGVSSASIRGLDASAGKLQSAIQDSTRSIGSGIDSRALAASGRSSGVFFGKTLGDAATDSIVAAIRNSKEDVAASVLTVVDGAVKELSGYKPEKIDILGSSIDIESLAASAKQAGEKASAQYSDSFASVASNAGSAAWAAGLENLAASSAKTGEDAGKMLVESATKEVDSLPAPDPFNTGMEEVRAKAIERGKELAKNFHDASSEELDRLFKDDPAAAREAGWTKIKSTRKWEEVSFNNRIGIPNRSEDVSYWERTIKVDTKSVADGVKEGMSSIKDDPRMIQAMKEYNAQFDFPDLTIASKPYAPLAPLNEDDLQRQANESLKRIDAKITPVNPAKADSAIYEYKSGLGASRQIDRDRDFMLRYGQQPIEDRSDVFSTFVLNGDDGDRPSGPPKKPPKPTETKGSLEELDRALERVREDGFKAAASIEEIDKSLQNVRPTSLGELTKATSKAVTSVTTLVKGIVQIAAATSGKNIGEDFIKTIVKIEGFANTAIGLAKSFDTVTKAGSKFVSFLTSARERAKLQRERLVAVAAATQRHADNLKMVVEAARAAGVAQERLIELNKQYADSTEAAAAASKNLADAEARTGRGRGRGGLFAGAGSTIGGLIRDQIGGNSLFDALGDKIGDAVEGAISKRGRGVAALAKRGLRRFGAGRAVLGGTSLIGRLIATAGAGGAGAGAAAGLLAKGGLALGAGGTLLTGGIAGLYNIGSAFAGGTSLKDTAISQKLGNLLFEFGKFTNSGNSIAIGANTAELVKKEKSLDNENLIREAYAQAAIRESALRRKEGFEQADRDFSVRQRVLTVQRLEIGDRFQRQVSESNADADRARAGQRRTFERQQAGLITDADAKRLGAQFGAQIASAEASRAVGVSGLVGQRQADLGRQREGLAFLRDQINISNQRLGPEGSGFAKSEEGQQELQRKVDLEKRVEESLREQISTIREIESIQRSANDDQIARLRDQEDYWGRIKDAALDAATSARTKLGETLLNNEGEFDRYIEVKKKIRDGQQLEDEDLKVLGRNQFDRQDEQVFRDSVRSKLSERLKSEGLSNLGSVETAEASLAAAKEDEAKRNAARLRNQNANISQNADAQVRGLGGQLRENIQAQADAERILVQTQVELNVNYYYKDVADKLRQQFKELNLAEKENKEIEKIVVRLFEEYSRKGQQAGKNS